MKGLEFHFSLFYGSTLLTWVQVRIIQPVLIHHLIRLCCLEAKMNFVNSGTNQWCCRNTQEMLKTLLPKPRNVPYLTPYVWVKETNRILLTQLLGATLLTDRIQRQIL